MIHELEKTYNPNIEERIYNNWLEKKYFHVNSIAWQWKKLVIDIVKNGNYENENLKRTIKLLDAQIAEREVMIAEREALIAEREAMIAEREARIAECNRLYGDL